MTFCMQRKFWFKWKVWTLWVVSTLSYSFSALSLLSWRGNTLTLCWISLEFHACGSTGILCLWGMRSAGFEWDSKNWRYTQHTYLCPSSSSTEVHQWPSVPLNITYRDEIKNFEMAIHGIKNEALLIVKAHVQVMLLLLAWGPHFKNLWFW